MAALTRKKVTVHGKRRTYQRTVMVRSITHAPVKFKLHNEHPGQQDGRMTLGKFIRRHGATYAGLNLGTGVLGGAGAGVGAHAGHKLGRFGHGVAAGWALGTGVGVRNQLKYLNRTESGQALVRDHNRLGTAGRVGAHLYGAAFQLGGNAAGLYGYSRLINRKRAS